MVKCSLFDVGQKKPITQNFQHSFSNSVSIMFRTYARPACLGYFIESNKDYFIHINFNS